MVFQVKRRVGSKLFKTKLLNFTPTNNLENYKVNMTGILQCLKKLYISESSLTNIIKVRKKLFPIIGYLSGVVI